MTKLELIKILYALRIAYGRKEARKLFEKIVRFIVS